VHLFTPTGGLGINTGMDDTANLAWKLAAVLQGWGGPSLPDTYEAERKPVAICNTNIAKGYSQSLGRMIILDGIEDDGKAGDRQRALFSAQLLGTQTYRATLGCFRDTLIRIFARTRSL